MSTRTRPASGAVALAEMKEFAGFGKGTQRYIRRSLDVGLDRRDAVRRWSRDPAEAAGIRAQERIYGRLDLIRANVPDDSGLDAMEPMMAPLDHDDRLRSRPGPAALLRLLPFPLRAADRRAGAPLAAGRLLRRRGACRTSIPDRRRKLLQSISEAAATAPGWSNREPVFYPEWVEKVDITVAG